jgi:hypothetical protein
MAGPDSTNREIVRQLRLTTLRRRRAQSIRRQIELIDTMFDEVEALQLRRARRVPIRLTRALVTVEKACGLSRGSLSAGMSVSQLQHALFDLQWVALRSLRGRWSDDADEPLRARSVA